MTTTPEPEGLALPPVSVESPEPRLEVVLPSRVHDVLEVLDDAAQWLAEQGIEQWPSMFDADGWRANQLAGQAGIGNVYLMRVAGRPVATVTITEWADPDFADGWPDGPEDAVYVMRLAKTRSARQMGLPLGSWLLDFANQVAAIREVSKVRLDCAKTNTRLHDYYLRQGFTRVGVVDAVNTHTGKPRGSGALFERPVPAPMRGGDWL